MVETPADDSAAMLIGVGGLGCQIAARCQPASGGRRLIDFDAVALAAYRAEETLHLLGEPEDDDPLSAQLAERAVAEGLAEFVETIDGEPFAVVVGAVGQATGCLVLPALAQELRAARCPTVVVAIEPLPFEGAPRAEMAARTLDELAHVADLVLTVPNRPFGEVCDPSLPIHQALARLTQKTREAIDQLLEAITDFSCVGLQPAELRRALVNAGRGAFGVGMGRGDDRVEDALRDACASSFLSPESCQRASAAILHLRGGKDLSLQEINNATDIVAHLVGRVPIQAGLSTCDDATDGVRALLLVMGIRSAEEDDVQRDGDAEASQDELSFHDGVNLDVPAYLRRKTPYRKGR